MKTEQASARMQGYQATIGGLLAQCVALADADPAVAREELAKMRWTLIRHLREYQLFKHGEIFDPAIVSGDGARAAMAEGMKARCLAIGGDYAAYVRRWSAADVAGEWPAYRTAMLSMAGAIRMHLWRERNEVELLLAGAACTRRLYDPAALSDGGAAEQG